MISGKKILVTAGPTYEPIDPVRFIGNRSSGKMGVAIADAFADEGGEVVLIKGPAKVDAKHPAVKTVHVETAEEMYLSCMEYCSQSDIIIMAAAVADYTPLKVHDRKLKKADGNLVLELKRTKDILAQMGSEKTEEQILIGFALESEEGSENAIDKLKRKKLDMIVLNSLQNKGAGFQHDTNRVTIFDKFGNSNKFDLKSKTEVAKDILNAVKNYASHVQH